MTASFEGLPALLAEIAEVAGLATALALAEERGGNRIYIPERAPDDHWLVRLVGRSATDKLCHHFATPSGIELELPRGPTGSRAAQWRELRTMIEAGRPSSEITRRLGISRRTVTRHRGRHETDDGQGSLF
jgi:hypothetical protein